MEKEKAASLAVGQTVKLGGARPEYPAYKIVGLSEGGEAIFLLRSSMIGRPHSEHAFQAYVGDINAVLI